MIRDFVSLLFPQNCLNCAQSLISEEQFICTNCKIDLPVTSDHKNPENDLFRKFAFEPKIKSASAYLYYSREGITRKLLHNLKYKGKKEIGKTLGQWMTPTLEFLEFDFVLPVPLHPSKVRKRGYNQSEQIAIGIAEVFALDVKSDLVKRKIATKSQTNKSKADRWINMENVYSEVHEDLSGQSVLIVDDVITTGATIGMLSQRLIQANVESIHLASVARGK
ncbi:comF family protein [Ekhidna lutea]|uniref:ComF family protein n=1 Tax=Ekhidna lutea TaxID=447679 RepID=A0A239EP69_EKHLU|nr:ComF family protein [Ekhidna lutea]SNS46466.1 comF family protein [Ekhidna lutea]